ncbi:hypothetical protein Tco_0004055 [Tanacetum coccineum]
MFRMAAALRAIDTAFRNRVGLDVQSSKKDRKLHLSMYGKASQLQKQMDAKSAWFQEKYSGRTHRGVATSSQTNCPLTEKEFHQLRMDEEALKEMLEEEAMNKKGALKMEHVWKKIRRFPSTRCNTWLMCQSSLWRLGGAFGKVAFITVDSSIHIRLYHITQVTFFLVGTVPGVNAMECASFPKM